MSARRIDWTAIRTKYVNGSVTFADLATEFGIRHQTVREHAAREH